MLERHWFGLLLVLGGCGGSRAEEVEVSPRPAGEENVRTRYTEADTRFMTDMIHHHAQALEMGALAPTHAASEPVRILAERIVAGQKDEIATMKRWLADRGEPVPDQDHSSHSGHGMRMPGMLSPEQMEELRQARGTEFDRLFLEYMIQHHQGAVTMVRELFATPGAAQEQAVFKFASDAHVDQATEVARMERMLAQLDQEVAP